MDNSGWRQAGPRPIWNARGGEWQRAETLTAETAIATELEPGLIIRHASAPAFVALKLAAHADRFADDPFASRDLQDAFAVIASRPVIVEEMKSAPTGVRAFAAAELRKLLAHPDAGEIVAAHLNDARPLAPALRWTLERARDMAEF